MSSVNPPSSSGPSSPRDPVASPDPSRVDPALVSPALVSPSLVAAAIAAVDRAAVATSAAQGRLAAGDTLTKDDASPVTVADFAAQAVVCRTLADLLGDGVLGDGVLGDGALGDVPGGVAVVGEETPDDLMDQPELLAGIGELCALGLGVDTFDASAVLDAVAIGAAPATPGGTYWTLDPIDGTKGFLRGDQYAIALALIVDGEVVLGVLGCPNLPNPDGTIGALLVGVDGAATIQPLGRSLGLGVLGQSLGAGSGGAGSGGVGIPIHVDDPGTLAEARLCESVESGHSDQSQSAQIATLLGIASDPYRIDSQCKYAAVARGDASIYLRLPTRADYVEKIWDHAAGKFVVECAGGVVTDVHGNPLDFARGAGLSANSGVIATSGRFHRRVVEAVGEVLGI